MSSHEEISLPCVARAVLGSLRTLAFDRYRIDPEHPVNKYVIDSTRAITVDVPAGSVTAIHHASAVELTCRCGVLWVTQENKTCDWILVRHETAVFSGRGVLVVTAVHPEPGSFSLAAKELSEHQRHRAHEGLAGLWF
jgi:Protein of unknown function (DUF2917)